jgi:hypothetical protein
MVASFQVHEAGGDAAGAINQSQNLAKAIQQER